MRNFQTELGNNLRIIQTRQSFTEALADVLEVGTNDLVLADMNTTSAEYLMRNYSFYLSFANSNEQFINPFKKLG